MIRIIDHKSTIAIALSALGLFIFGAVGSLKAQTPFTTDDADVTEKRKFHVEFLNEYDLLQRSLAPNLRQDSAICRFSYGIAKNVEVGVDVPVLVVFNAPGTVPRRPFGFSDVGFHIKAKIHEEKKGSKLPAFAVAFATRFPTGNSADSLGSGVTNYQLYGVLQRSLSEKTKLRVNAGVLFAGNTVIGALGIRTTKGELFSGGASVVRQFTEKLKLGAEITGVANGSFQLSKGQLQTTFGGNYSIKKDLTLDFGLIAGRYPASPRIGALTGITVDF